MMRALGVFGLTVVASFAHAETVTICSQRIDFSPRFQRDALPPEQRALWGIWEGEISFGSQFRFCAGFLFGRIDEKGEPNAIYAYSTADAGLLNTAKVGSASWGGGRYRNGTLVMKSPEAVYELRRVNEDTLEGTYTWNGIGYPATLKRRKSSN
jgi:hypothetical protein